MRKTAGICGLINRESRNMMRTLTFILNSILLGVGLAMDAFSVSIVNGMQDTKMSGAKARRIAGVFAFFQFLMPMAGWLCVHTVVTVFSAVEPFIPWVALGLLTYIGGGMILKALRGGEKEEIRELGKGTLLVQGVATSIDALSVGFTIAEYGWVQALTASLLIALVTYIICRIGVSLGRRAGDRLQSRAMLLGGVILVGIGIEILVRHLLGL